MPSPGLSGNLVSAHIAGHVGLQLSSILYGVEVYLYFKTMRIYLDPERKRRHSDIFYGLFSTIMFLFISPWLALELFAMVVEHPSKRIAFKYYEFMDSVPFILQSMTDGLMIYRCRMVWDSSRVIIIPCILWVAAFSLGITYNWASARQRDSIIVKGAANITLSYFAISVFLTASLTVLICYRLAQHGRTMKKHLGAEYAAIYFNVVVFLVESVLPYSLTGVAFVLAMGFKTVASVSLGLIYITMMSVSPQMLILRVAAGTAFKKETLAPLQASLEFSPNENISGADGTGTAIRFESSSMSGESSSPGGLVTEHKV